MLLCITHAPRLRRTGPGSSPAQWNLLDNVKLHYEQVALEAAGLPNRADEDDEGPPHEPLDSGRAPEDDPWEAFVEGETGVGREDGEL